MRQQLKMWIGGEKGSGNAGKTLTAKASVGKQCFKVEMTKRAGDWLKAKERSFSIRRDGQDYVCCDSNELSNFMVTYGHIPTSFYNSDSGYKRNSAVQVLFEPRGEAIRNMTANYVLQCKVKLKLPKFNTSINGVKCVQEILIESFYLEHLTEQFLDLS